MQHTVSMNWLINLSLLSHLAEYQGRERDFLHREEYHITQLEDKDSHYNALVKALKDRVSLHPIFFFIKGIFFMKLLIYLYI